MLRFAWLLAVFVVYSVMHHAVARADDREAARAWFEQGVGHASRQEWTQAADAFERSRTLDERVPTLFNLMLAYDALNRPLDVARTVRSFLTRADPGRHQAERARALELEAKAYAALARLSVQLQPSHAQVQVDGADPVLAADAQAVLLTPGTHELRCAADGYDPKTIALDVTAGERRVIDVVLSASPATPQEAKTPPAAPVLELATQPKVDKTLPPVMAPAQGFAAWRRPVARAFAIVGGATWLGSAVVLGAAYGRASKLESRDSTEPGFLTASDDYQRLTRAVVPLSLVSAGVLSTAAACWPRKRRWHDWAVAGAGLALVAVGVGLAIREPPAIPGTGLDQPRRPLGIFVAASGAPLLAFPWGKPASER